MRQITSENPVLVLTAGEGMIFEVYSMPNPERVYCFNYSQDSDASDAFIVLELTVEEAINEISGRIIDGLADWEFVNDGHTKLGISADMIEQWQSECVEEAE